mmetsp:Transcript_55674/g.148031  ORF Transcript_55674/g.148031 Transcript_55674/m.148031 type:complete len:333 (-) Transcript_55674:97-1095(-)
MWKICTPDRRSYCVMGYIGDPTPSRRNEYRRAYSEADPSLPPTSRSLGKLWPAVSRRFHRRAVKANGSPCEGGRRATHGLPRPWRAPRPQPRPRPAAAPARSSRHRRRAQLPREPRDRERRGGLQPEEQPAGRRRGGSPLRLGHQLLGAQEHAERGAHGALVVLGVGVRDPLDERHARQGADREAAVVHTVVHYHVGGPEGGHAHGVAQKARPGKRGRCSRDPQHRPHDQRDVDQAVDVVELEHVRLALVRMMRAVDQPPSRALWTVPQRSVRKAGVILHTNCREECCGEGERSPQASCQRDLEASLQQGPCMPQEQKEPSKQGEIPDPLVG